MAGVLSNDIVFDPDAQIEPDRPSPKRGRRDEPDVLSVKEVALRLAQGAWHRVEWREGTNELLSSRFARVRLWSAHRRAKDDVWSEEWLLIEWPEGEPEPTKYWLSTLPQDIAFARLVALAKLRWRIERDYHDLKQELGLDHFEGRSWRGFHHHASLCIAAYGFLISERETISPSRPGPARSGPKAGLPKGHRPRGTPDPARAAYPQLHRHAQATTDHRPRQASATMSLLRTDKPLMTQ